MDNVEQILIRMGVDAKAVVLGMNQVSALAKGWAASLVEEVQGKLGTLFAAGAAIEGFNKVREEILEISRLSDELGTSTNFIQSLQLKAQQMGVGIETLTRPLVQFNRQVGEAKRGIPEAIEQLKDMGVISDKNQLATLTYAQAMASLKVQFDKIGDSAKQDALLNEAFGNSAYRVAFIFRQSMGEFQQMSEGNFFTKFSTDSINDFQSLWNAIKAGFYSVGVTVTNGFDRAIYQPVKGIAQELALMVEKRKLFLRKSDWDELFQREQINDSIHESAALTQDDIEVQQKKAEILSEQAALLEHQTELQAEIADRDKSSISEMAEHYRRTLGLPQIREYGVSGREKQAYQVQTLEQRAAIAFNQGKDDLFLKLRSEADQLRASQPWLKLQDRNPLQRTEAELDRVNEQLGPVKEMAKLVLETHKGPQ
jgi:hypothetical protein